MLAFPFLFFTSYDKNSTCPPSDFLVLFVDYHLLLRIFFDKIPASLLSRPAVECESMILRHLVSKHTWCFCSLKRQFLRKFSGWKFGFLLYLWLYFVVTSFWQRKIMVPVKKGLTQMMKNWSKPVSFKDFL